MIKNLLFYGTPWASYPTQNTYRFHKRNVGVGAYDNPKNYAKRGAIMELPQRKQLRLGCYDYSSAGYYFVTLCTQNRQPILCKIVGDDIPTTVLTPIGKIVKQYIISSNKINGLFVDKFVIMPDHVHILIGIKNDVSSETVARENKIVPHFVSTLKRFVHRDVGRQVFQRSYHDHVIRGEQDYREIWQYIENNPLKYRLKTNGEI